MTPTNTVSRRKAVLTLNLGEPLEILATSAGPKSFKFPSMVGAFPRTEIGRRGAAVLVLGGAKAMTHNNDAASTISPSPYHTPMGKSDSAGKTVI